MWRVSRPSRRPPEASYRKSTDYAVWQIKVTPQEAIGQSSTMVPFAWTV
jgi:hypothetical protein